MESVNCSTGARSSVNMMSLDAVGTRFWIVFSNIFRSNGCEFAGKLAKLYSKLLADVGDMVATTIELKVFGTSITWTVG